MSRFPDLLKDVEEAELFYAGEDFCYAFAEDVPFFYVFDLFCGLVKVNEYKIPTVIDGLIYSYGAGDVVEKLLEFDRVGPTGGSGIS